MQESYYDKHRDKLLNYQKSYYKEHKKQINEYHNRWYQKNKHIYGYKRKDSTSPTYNKQVLYSVWNNFTDEVVIVDGNYTECAKAMGISVNSFYSLVSRAKHGKSKKWTIEKKRLREKRK